MSISCRRVRIAIDRPSARCRDGSDYVRVLTVNTVGSFLMTKTFLPLLRFGPASAGCFPSQCTLPEMERWGVRQWGQMCRKKRTRVVVNTSSVDGSIGTNRSGQYGKQAGMQLAYSSSKAALNMRAPPACYRCLHSHGWCAWYAVMVFLE